MSEQVYAYRALVDRNRFAVVHAHNLLHAGDLFRAALPEVNMPFTAQRLPWEGSDRQPGVEIRTRTVPLA